MTYSRIKLTDVCRILPGMSVRGRLEPASGKGVFAIHLRDISPAGDVQVEQLAAYDIAGSVDRYLIEEGDVVFRSRGDWTTAAPITAPIVLPIIAIMPVFILRPKSEGLDPRYLAWAINEQAGQRQLDQRAQGGGVRMVSKTALEALEIILPGLDVQRRIVEVAELARREHELIQAVSAKRLALNNFLLSRAARWHVI